MKTFLSLCLACASFFASADCGFKPTVSKVVSLSGVTTVLFKELGLLGHPKLKGISVFNPVGEKDFSGTIYPGGVFLSHNALSGLNGSVVFYDESRELRKILQSQKNIVGKEIKTRNLVPEETVRRTIITMQEVLQNCGDRIESVYQKVYSLQEKILKKVPHKLKVIFYLGELRSERVPEMVIVQDGVVKWLIQKNKIITYPSELSYVNWSSKILQEMPKETNHVGIVDSGRLMNKELKKIEKGVTLIYPGALVPGITQLEAFLFWAESL